MKFNLAILSLLFFSVQMAGQNRVYDGDRNSYRVIKLDNGDEWTAGNMRVKVPLSYIYQHSPSYQREGRLYHLKYADKACRSLGPGWKVPRIGDWENLIEQAIKFRYGEVSSDRNFQAGQAYTALIAKTMNFQRLIEFNLSGKGYVLLKDLHQFEKYPGHHEPDKNDFRSSPTFLTTSPNWGYQISGRAFKRISTSYGNWNQGVGQHLRCVKN